METLASKAPNISLGIKTRYKFISVHPETGVETPLSGWSDNMIVTAGRNELAKRDWFTYCQVGTDSTLPALGQTALLGFIAGTNTIVETTYNAQSTPPYFGYKRKRFRFAAGSGIGGQNLSEVAVAWAASGSTIAARALIVDSLGNQTTITPLADELLDVLVEIRYYPPLDDVTGTLIIDGVTYDYILRAASVTSAGAWAQDIGNRITSYAVFTTDWSVFDDDIGSITTGPSGVATSSDSANDFTEAYAENSYQIKFGMFVGPNGWNALTGKLMRSLRILTTAGHYQIQFDSQVTPGFGIPKTNAKVIYTRFILAWNDAGPEFVGSIPTQNWTQGVPATLVTASYFADKPEPLTFTIFSGALPTGLSLNSATGEITGTPTVVSSGSFQIQCANEVGTAVSNSVIWTVS